MVNFHHPRWAAPWTLEHCYLIMSNDELLVLPERSSGTGARSPETDVQILTDKPRSNCRGSKLSTAEADWNTGAQDGESQGEPKSRAPCRFIPRAVTYSQHPLSAILINPPSIASFVHTLQSRGQAACPTTRSRCVAAVQGCTCRLLALSLLLHLRLRV